MSSDNSASQMTPRFIRCTSCAWHGQDESLDPVLAHTLLCPACEEAECCDDVAEGGAGFRPVGMTANQETHMEDLKRSVFWLGETGEAERIVDD